MSEIGQIERITQNRVIKLFREELGYQFLGNWEEREINSNIEEELLTNYLKRKDYSSVQINKAIYDLRTTAIKTDTNNLPEVFIFIIRN